ncbi:SGNH family hydrolase [Helicobacter cinaedi]|uniref:SGNH/GDSL hydrolase family protein n=1 Tax=Helicobacter cinaedi TaxID=213 RepID=UPI000CF129B4|nr:SGNH family hydrolase [Helicobacter cinaedi]
MRALQFVFIALFTFLQLLFYLHSSIVSYVEQQYHNFSESENVFMEFVGSAYNALYLQDNALFALSDKLMGELESLRSKVFGLLEVGQIEQNQEELDSKQDSALQGRDLQKDSSDTNLDKRAESHPDSKPYDLDSKTLESNPQDSNPQDSTLQEKPPLDSDSKESNPIEAVLKNIATTDDSAPTLPKDLQDLSNLPTSNPQTESTLDFSKPFPQDLPKPTPPTQPPQPTPPPLQESYTPLRSINNPRIQVSEGDGVLLIGDSMMQGVAPYLLRTFKKVKIQGINLSKHSTGLTYKHYFNWELATRDALEKNPHISLIVVLLGANDPWSMKKGIAFKSPLWEEIYTQRIDEILQVAREYGVRVAWYEVPSVREKSLNDKIMYLNSLYEESVKQSGEYFLQSNGIVTQGGKYSAFIKNAKGKSVQVRADDGVHFTTRGYQIMASILLNSLEVLPLENAPQESEPTQEQMGVME